MNLSKISKPKVIFLAVILLLVVGSLLSAFYFFQQYQKIKKNPEIVSQEEVRAITAAISKSIELPSDEQPTVATVTDQEKLKSQDFFKKALNGDKVLIYTKAHKAILYRPSTDRIIEFAPVTFGAQEQSNIQTPIKVAIYNGTNTSGLTAEYERKLGEIASISITTKAIAAKGDYTKPIIVDLSGKNQDTANQIAQLFNGDVTTKLPDGESRPQADILVIIGK